MHRPVVHIRARAAAMAFAVAVAMTPTLSLAQSPAGIDWQLLAIDGQVVDFDATLRVEENGGLGGKAPCNSWSSMNAGTLPDLQLRGIRATRMACAQLAEEQVFFDTLSAMTRLENEGVRNLVLTGPDGRSMEFVTDRMNSLTVCKTCPPKD
jgi:heat shock protein HslJ